MIGTARKLLIMDACVLIDFVKSDPAVIKLISNHIGPAHVVSTVLDEVKDFKHRDELVRLGLIILEPDLEDLFEAAGGSGPTSFQDKICLLTAKRHGLACVTNDKNLRRRCTEEGVPIYWGQQLLAELHRAGGITFKAVKEIALAIHENNHRHITTDIIERFLQIMSDQES